MLRFLALVLFLLGCSHGAVRANDPIVVIQRAGEMVCSGFAISEHEIVTAAHCVEPGETVRIVTHEQYDTTASATTRAEIIYHDPNRDIAVLATPGTFSFPIHIREPVVGENVTVVSALFGWVHSDGEVLFSSGLFADTDVTIQKGWSGSPVIGFDGAAVGIVSRCMAKYEDGMAICLPHDMQFSVLP